MALVGSPTNATSSSADQERQFTNELQHRGVEPAPTPALAPAAETLQATREMCAYCFGKSYFLCFLMCWRAREVEVSVQTPQAAEVRATCR